MIFPIYDKLYLKFETEFVGQYVQNLFYLETDTDRKEILREEILRRRKLAEELYESMKSKD